MTISILQALADALTSTEALSVAAFGGALLAAHCGCGRCGGDDHDEEGGADEGADFNFSKEELAEYKEFVEQANARITELAELLDADDATDKRETLAELTNCYLSRGARFQESGEDEKAIDDYAAAFARYAEYVDEFGESLDLLKKIAAGRLAYGNILNDSAEYDDADDAYALAEEANAKLAKFGDREAALDLVGVKLNRATIAFERGDHTGAFDALDDAAEEFQKLADEPETTSAEAIYYLAKTYATKASFLRATLEEEDLDSPNALEAAEAYKKARELFQNLVESGNSQYRYDLADAIAAYVAVTSKRTKEELEEAAASLKEACELYDVVARYGETDACGDLFDAALLRADYLVKLERDADAAKLYDTILDTFGAWSESGELPIVEGLAIAFQRRATLRKGTAKPDAVIADLTKAIEYQSAIAESLIGSLNDKGDGCGCGGHGHDHDGCGCGGHGHDHDGGGCGGHSHDHDGCGCGGHGHDHDGCGCGGCGGCAPERKFLVERWANDNYRALCECFYERIGMYLEKRDTPRAAADCAAVEELTKAYREVLKEGETLDDEVFKKIRTLRAAL